MTPEEVEVLIEDYKTALRLLAQAQPIRRIAVQDEVARFLRTQRLRWCQLDGIGGDDIRQRLWRICHTVLSPGTFQGYKSRNQLERAVIDSYGVLESHSHMVLIPPRGEDLKLLERAHREIRTKEKDPQANLGVSSAEPTDF